jgi:hypothetical protein
MVFLTGGVSMINKDNFVVCRGLYDKKGKRANCKWSGKIEECVEEFFSSPHVAWALLAGREGYIYHCPKCGCVVATDWTRVS